MARFNRGWDWLRYLFRPGSAGKRQPPLVPDERRQIRAEGGFVVFDMTYINRHLVPPPARVAAFVS